MDGDAVFALIFLLFAIGGLLYASFVEFGGEEILAEKVVKFIDSRNKKKEDI